MSRPRPPRPTLRLDPQSAPVPRAPAAGSLGGAGPEAAPVRAAILPGDGVGPEIMEATLRILDAAGAPVDAVPVTLGDPRTEDGRADWEAGLARVRETGALLKGPLAGGLSAPLRSDLALYCHIRRATALAPFVPARGPGMDVLVIRESEEDLYCGLEQRQTADVAQCVKLVTRPATERFLRTAFAWARAAGRRRVTCVTKDNVLRLTDGLFHEVFREVAADSPDLQADHMIVDAAAARMAEAPESFDVIVAPNLYGDILADLAAQMAGRPSLTPSVRIGPQAAVFEPVHGTAAHIAGKGAANPSGLILSAVKLLRHLGRGGAARLVRDAWLRTIEDGVHTPDIHRPNMSRRRVGSRAFADAVIERLGERPARLRPSAEAEPFAAPACPSVTATPARRPGPDRRLAGVDLGLVDDALGAEALAARLAPLAPAGLSLERIANRGATVWPVEGGAPTPSLLADQWTCRFAAEPGVAPAAVAELMRRAMEAGLDVARVENLYAFGDVPGWRPFEATRG
jgi:isocitrate dehydrogenase